MHFDTVTSNIDRHHPICYLLHLVRGPHDFFSSAQILGFNYIDDHWYLLVDLPQDPRSCP